MSANSIKVVDPEERHTRKIMGIKIQELIKDLKNAHSQPNPNKKSDLLENQQHLQMHKETKVL